MKKSIAMFATVASLALATVASSASAASFVFTFSGTGGINGASGTLEAMDNGDGTFTATSGTINAFGTVASGAGTLTAGSGNSPSGFFTYDDTLLPGQNPLLTAGGLLFEIAGAEINIYSAPGGTDPYVLYSNSGANATGNFALSEISAAVPETATWAMMLMGFGMVGAGLRSHKRSTVRVTYA
ncbi:PEPxxWA-CTERM sorting domain-containing protein [Sphingomonas sp. CARO-RG-8B-R24-01]|uniref:PEPxxWA-CTERM sorting domain-containing protein n=1 Tax=Sphingomonas sp. CARO-RG-8B-R24-01 TaxID=2914831 RepID=UPI001F588177|nr:PEPxxWA-CTERM sorting domain-containing protein [Sphingomonas sp. CARO-RG-8B-R24-01]